MHLKMDTWHSQWMSTEGSYNEITDSVDFTHFRNFYHSTEDNNDSPNASRDNSIESYGDDQPDKNDAILKPTFKSVLQAKKRLRAFSAAKQLKKSDLKEEKGEEGEKSDKMSPKKSKKALYPDDKAKAVIQEIEEIKRMEGHLVREDLPRPEVVMPPTSVKSISLKEVIRARSRSLSSDREHFKRREIKCRNYRRKSVSPEDYGRRKSPTKKVSYPKNWTEYKEQNLTISKDYELKSKLFPKQKYAQHDLVSRIINFDTPSPPIEAFKSTTIENKIEIVPASFMRVTRAKPSLAYSINFIKNKECFMSRKQLFNIISRDRREIIEKIFNTPSSKSQPSAKNIHSRQWYSKTWKKVTDAECKILENSVGLSFLQTYSDEEEENDTEEIVICSSSKKNGIRDSTPPERNLDVKALEREVKSKSQKQKLEKPVFPVEKAKSKIEKVERSKALTEKLEKDEPQLKKTEKTKHQEEKPAKVEETEKLKQQVEKSPKGSPLKKIDISMILHKTEDNGKLEQLTPEKKCVELKKWQRDELNETRRAIKELEEELERRKAIKLEEESKEEKKALKKKQKKDKKKQELSSDSEEEEEAAKKKNKKKSKPKKKIQVEEDSPSSDDEKRKKKNKKEKYKKEKFRKKKEKNRKEDLKESKSKKKDEDSDDDNLKDESKKKKKKSITDDTISLNDKNKYLEVVKKKKKKRKRSVDTEVEEAEEESEELVLQDKKKSLKEKEKNKDSSGKKKQKKNKWDDFDIENYNSGNEKYNQNKPSKLIDLDEIQLMNESKQVEIKEDNKKVQKSEKASKEKSSKCEKELKRHEEEDRKKPDKESYKHEKESKRSKGESEKIPDVILKTKKDPEETPKAKDADDVMKLKKHEEHPDNKHANKDKPKTDADRGKKTVEKTEEKDKRAVESKDRKGSNTIRDRKSSEKSEKNDHQRKRDDSHDRHHDERSEKHQKERRNEDRHNKLENIKVKPDWDNLRNKRKKHRDSDGKDAKKDMPDAIYFPEELENFPIEKEASRLEKGDDRPHNRKSRGERWGREFGTPDTDDYRENWEKDTFPIWESEDDVLPRPKEKLNNSWESDEETFERGHRAVEAARPFREAFDLEIPLNIKPFKRREVINPDIELQLLKRENITLSEERRRLEIEKQRVKELELKVIREVENKVLENQFKSKRRRSLEEKASRTYEREKVGRWDKKDVQPKKSTKTDVIELSPVKNEKSDEDCVIIDVSCSTPNNNTAAALENEYEEFIKAVTSSATPKRKPDQKKSKQIEIISSSSSFSSLSDSESRASEHSQAKKKKKEEHVDRNHVVPKTTAAKSDNENHLDASINPTITILPKDIPLIPMPAPIEVKPVPVPSPQIDVDKIPKPLIKLGLSTNVTLDIASKLASPSIDSPSGKSTTEFINSPIHNFDIASKLIMPSISTPPSVKSLEFRHSPAATPIMTQSPLVQMPEQRTPSSKPEAIVSFASPLTDASLDSTLFEDKSTVKESERLNKPFVFTSMVIQSKRLLLDNSNLNLDDSDDEGKCSALSMKSLEEIKKESLNDSTKIVGETEETNARAEKHREVGGSSQVTVEKSGTAEKKDRPKSKSPISKKVDSKRQTKEKAAKRDVSPRRGVHARRDPSPRRKPRELSPKRRRISPRRHGSPRRRSPTRRRSSPAKRKSSPRRSNSPRYRRRSVSPRRRSSPKRSKSPKMRPSSPKRIRSKSPEPPQKFPEPPPKLPDRPPSPITTITSPLEGLKRSVADSTISDDLLPQPSINLDDYAESPISRFYDRNSKQIDSPKRVPLDDRINQVLGLQKEEPKPIPTTFSNYNNYQHTQYAQQYIQLPKQEHDVAHMQIPAVRVPVQQSKSNFVQVGNMVRIVPTEDMPTTVSQFKAPPKNLAPALPPMPSSEPVPPVPKVEKSHILQVGNMLQIVPADLSPEPPLPPEPKVEPKELPPETAAVIQEKQSAEVAMKLKIAERRAERELRREEREKRRKDKEKRRKEKEKKRQIKLKQRTENMIKKALQLEVEGLAGEDDDELFLSEKPTQWPPLPVVSSISKEVGKSILIKGGQNKNEALGEKRKIVQFADGVRPGEGTSPSGGEELSSPPPASKKLPKEKRYKKTKLLKKNQKKKVKVKVIKKRLETEDSDEEDNLPPPSPPPGSPPPHIFPPRIKTHTINNVHPYIPNVVSIQTSHNQQLYRPPLNIIMHHHPPGPPHHHHHGPPPPPGPPGPPHHHGPPPPPGPPHHHGPPPPGPPHFHHGPPPPPGPPHHHVPPPPHGPPGHHGPPPPYHH